MTKLTPLYDRLVVRRQKPKDRTEGGIYIPETAKEKPVEGEVLAVGQGRMLADGSLRTLAVEVGQRVLFGKYAGQTALDDEDLLVIREDDVLGILE